MARSSWKIGKNQSDKVLIDLDKNPDRFWEKFQAVEAAVGLVPETWGCRNQSTSRSVDHKAAAAISGLLAKATRPWQDPGN
ncbi:hypothetical protein RU639_000638 [Aspergillus parasiticus]